MSTIVANAVASILAAQSLEQLLGKYDALFPLVNQQDNPPDPVFGVDKISGVSIDRTRKAANAAAMDILQRVGTDHSKLTEEDKAVLRRYSGLGGIGGSIHEYYTPQWVADGIWGAMASHGLGAGNILEPSAGAGVFHGTKPKGAVMTATEIDATSSQINQLLHPEDRVMNASFESLATSTEDGIFDGVVGNVPFGDTRGGYGSIDEEYKNVKYVDAYFVTRMLDKIKAGSMLCVVVPMRIVSGAKFKKLREEISYKGEFLGAHRLPSGTFGNNGTDTATDILIMRKHPEEFSDLVNERKTADLKTANVLWDTFINGKWFETTEGKRFIHGEETTSGAGKFMRTVVDRGNITNDEIKAKLAHKFESRIDWLSLELSEPVSPTYGEGDERLMNGRWHRLVNGQWQVVSLTAADGDTIDKATYGHSSVSGLSHMLNQDPLNALELSYEQLMATARDFPRITEGVIANAIKLANSHDEKHRERIIRGVIIGQKVQDLSEIVNQTGNVPVAEASALRDLISNEISMFGVAAADKRLSALKGGISAGSWNQFVKATDVNGKFSDLLMATIARGNTRAFDDTAADQTVSYLFGQLNLNPVELEDFKDLYRGTTPPTLEDLAKVDGIAITADGMLMPMDRATSGNTALTIERIQAAMTSQTNPAILDNYQRQLDEIKARRKWSKVDDIEINMTAKWLPRRYALEFLKENGYSQFEYSKIIDQDGEMIEDKEYNDADGVFSGYGIRDGKKRTNSDEQFERQLENYLNGVTVRSANAAAASAYRDRIANIEKQYAIWIRQHDDIDQLVKKYNDNFNYYVPFEHTDSDLELGDEYLSGKVKPFGYQCSGVRRLSEDGRGILGFDTGLGKTTTALSLVAYNTKMGRSKRTAIVVPLAVYENWYHEAKTAYSAKYFEQCLFVGIEPVRTKDGEIEQEPVLDDEQKPKTGANGEPLMRDKLRTLSTDEITSRMNEIPQTNKAVVVMTKERFATIPMRPDSIEARTDKMVGLGIESGKLEAAATNHTQANKKDRAREKASDTGSSKKLDIPYFEDMGFDSVVIDEGHNYRNSYKAGREASKLAYLPTSASAKIAIDLAVKSDYLRDKFNGRGVVMLTATPTVNSPIDIFNMLSHVMSPEEWARMGIYDADDFVKVFGETEEVTVQKLSGAVETKQGLTGFKNLTGLRSIFHRWVNLKDAKSVSETVKIPDLDEQSVEAPMTEEQAAIYEELRLRAAALSKPKTDGLVALDDNNEIIPEDSVFAIIRDMDRVCTDTDLYNRTMTFRLPIASLDAVKQLAEDLPATKTVKKADADKEDEEAEQSSFTVDNGATITTDDYSVTLVVHEQFEDEVIKRLKKFGINKNDVSHPITPKYARLIENLKNSYENGGKQIIFTEEKSQHNKLARIIANQLGIPSEEISIINADTVKGKSSDDDLRGLETIAAAFNEGKIKILICNKKAEVGVNLHHGTTDIHHLTLPWTPASIKQRNGRGARVGSKQAKVRVWYYVGKGSFDEFRLKTLKHKANWQNELFTSDAERMKNADADDGAEASLLLASDPEERKARIEANLQAAKEKVRQAAKQRANIDLHNYLKAAHDVTSNREEVASDLQSARDLMADLNRQHQSAVKFATDYRANSVNSVSLKDWYLREAKQKEKEAKTLLERLNTTRKDVARLDKKLNRMDQATNTMKRLRPQLEKAQQDELLTINSDVLDNGGQYLTDGTKMIRVGRLYKGDFGGRIMRVDAINFDTKTATVTLLFDKNGKSYELNKQSPRDIKYFGNEVSYTPTEIEVLQELMSSVSPEKAVQLLDREKYYEYLSDGTLKLEVSNYIRHAGSDDFESNMKSSVKLKEDLLKVIYPDPNDDGLKSKLAAWALKNKNVMRDYSNETSFLRAVFGENYRAAIEQYGNKASEQQINEWLAEQLKNYRSSEAAISELAKVDVNERSYYDNNFGSFARENLPEEFDNRTEFGEAIKRGTASLLAEKKARLEALYQRESAENEALWTVANSDSYAARKARLLWLEQFAKTLGRDVLAGSKGMRKLRESTDTPYSENGGRFNLALAASDIVTAKLAKAPTGFTRESLSFVVTEGLETFTGRNYSFSSSNLTNWMMDEERLILEAQAAEEAAKNPQPEREPAPESIQEPEPTPVPAKKAEAETVITAIKQSDELPKIGNLTLRINTKAFQTGGGKYRSGGGWRSRASKQMNAGEWIGIQDPAGKDGVLFRRKEDLKAAVGSGNAIFSSDASDEFGGAWWFVPATTSHETLLKALGA